MFDYNGVYGAADYVAAKEFEAATGYDWQNFKSAHNDTDERCTYVAPPPDFEVGDVVMMRGQPGQLMTVEGYCADCGTVDVAWFSGNDADGWEPHRDSFDEMMLINLEAVEADGA